MIHGTRSAARITNRYRNRIVSLLDRYKDPQKKQRPLRTCHITKMIKEEERVLQSVMRNVLGRKPGPDDYAEISRDFYPGFLDYILVYKGIDIGIIRRSMKDCIFSIHFEKLPINGVS